MVLTIPTGRNPTERVEVAPKHCPNGHPLGPRQVLVGYGTGRTAYAPGRGRAAPAA